MNNYPPEVLWLQKNASMLNIYQIEKQVGLPGKAIYNTLVKGLYAFNEDHWPKIISWCKRFTDIGGNPAPKQTETKIPDIKTKKTAVSKVSKTGAKNGLKSTGSSGKADQLRQLREKR